MFKLLPYQVHYFDLRKDAWYIQDFQTEQLANDYITYLKASKDNAEITLKVEA